MSTSTKSRVLIPSDRWTPVRSEIFDEQLAQLKERASGLVYLILYDRCWHRDGHRICGSIAEISGWCGLDERTVGKCVAELEGRKFIRRVRMGVSHSHINKPCWSVPLTEFLLNEEQWIPVPRFLITRYLKRFTNSVLLLLLLRYQHINWQNKCWVGIATLCRRTGWSPSRVRNSLRTMGHKKIWKKQQTKLPWPLEISYSDNGERRHFGVRAVRYERAGKKGRKVTTVEISPEFGKRFDI